MGIVMSFTRVTPEELASVEDDPEGADDLADAAYERARKAGGPDGYLDKAWSGLDYLFSAARVPVTLEDDVLDLDDEGRLGGWDADAVAATARALRSTSFDDLARHYDPVRMTDLGIYPNIWVRDGDEALDYLRHHFTVLVRFFDDAASRGCAAIKSLG